MTALRQRMIDDLKVRNRSLRTIQSYVAQVAKFARHFGKSPELLGPEEIRQYQVYLVEQGRVSWSNFNQAVCALSRALHPPRGHLQPPPTRTPRRQCYF